MRTTITALAIAALFLTAGCGDRQEQTIRDPATGDAVTIQSGDRLRAPSNLPAHAPIYPGAAIENVMEGTSSGEGGASSGGMVVMRSDADVETVARFYRERFDASGLTERSETRISGALSLRAASGDNAGDSVQVTVAPADDQAGSIISMAYSRAG